jgi:hypothetical protein
MRCCYYGHTTLKGKQIEEALARDKEVFIFATMQNISTPSTPAVKALVEKEMAGRQMIGLYHKRLKQAQERWGREAKPETEWGAELMDDLLPKTSEEERRFKALDQKIEAVAKQLKSVSSVAQWSLVGLIAIVVLLLRKAVF